MEGTSFRQGETVEVTVNLIAGTIAWSVNQKEVATVKHKGLSEKSSMFVPAIEFYHSSDIV